LGVDTSVGQLLVSEEEAFAIATYNLRRLAVFGVIEKYSETRDRFASVLGFELPEQFPS
jgi:hypothetical protein